MKHIMEKDMHTKIEKYIYELMQTCITDNKYTSTT